MGQTIREYACDARSALSHLHAGAAAYIQGQGFDPAAGSIAASESASYPRQDSLLTVRALANLLIEVVGDHVGALEKLLVEPVETFACWTCVRSMMESAAIVAWLYDPKADAQTRVGRSFALRYEGMEQEAKCARAFNYPAAKLKQLETHVDEVEQIARSLGFERVANQNRRRTGIGQRMPSATELIKMVLNEEKAYRLLSGVAHGHFWAIHQLGFTSPAIARQVVVSGVAVKAVEKHGGSLEMVAYLTLRAAKSMALALWHQCLYFGWPRDPLMEVFEVVYDKIRVSAEQRFWR